MAFIPTPGAVRVDIQYQASEQQVHNVIWCTREAAWTEAERTALANAIRSWWDTTGKAKFSAGLLLTQITVVNQDASNSPSTTVVVNPPIAGTLSENLSPNHTACCVTLRTDNRGRSFRGRMYLGPLTVNDIENSITILQARVTGFLTILASLKDAIEALGAIWVVVSHFANKLPRTTGLKTPITAFSADTYIDSQRRRLGLRGV